MQGLLLEKEKPDVSDQSPQTLEEEQQQRPGKTELMVNDFSIQVATVNGSGSQSSNSVLLRSIFQMGIPVSGQKTSSLPTSLAFPPGLQFASTKTVGLRAKRKSIS